MADDIHAEIQAKLNANEPEEYNLLTDPRHRGHEFGDTFRTIGLCTNMEAGGFTDESMVIVTDKESNPIHFIEYCIHEGLHATYPQLSEREVYRGAKQIAEFVGIMLRLKGVTLPQLKVAP